MSHFTPLPALAGGVLIGISAAMLLVFQGRIAGISGILAGLVSPRTSHKPWRATFLAGLVGGGALAALVAPAAFTAPPLSAGGVLFAGFLVGIGTRVGGGCTSGHGVCGLGRLSRRSLAAVATFMASGAATVAAGRLLGGGL